MDRSGRRGVLLTLAGVFVLAALVVAVPPLREAVTNVVSGDAGELRQELRDLGAAGALVLAGLMLVHAVVPFPSELVNAAAGFVYGFWLALPLVLAGWLLSALATYAIGRSAARPLLLRLAGEERLEEGARLVERGGITALLAARLVPIVPTAPSATSPAPRRCRCGASPGRPWSARSPCAPRSCTSASGSTRSRRPTPACSSRSAPSWRCAWAGACWPSAPGGANEPPLSGSRLAARRLLPPARGGTPCRA